MTTLPSLRRRPRPGLDRENLVRVVVASTAVTTVVQAATAALALPRGRRDYADGAWGPGLAAIAVTSAALGTGDRGRRWALAAATTAWAARLSTVMLPRLRSSDDEDDRYTEFLEGDGTAKAAAKVFLTQGVAQLVVSAPLQLAAASDLPASRRRHLLPLGLALMAAGGVVEALADRQKSRYQERDRDERPDVLDTGLWGVSRHPNYLGDSVVWDGAWLASAASAPAGWAWPAPVAMSYALMFTTGAKRTERRMEDRPGYRDYQDRVPFFFPDPRRLLSSPSRT